MDPMLEAPRELADRALEPLKPLELPPKPLAPIPLLDGMLRLPIWSLPLRFAVAPAVPRLAVLGAALGERLAVDELVARLEAPGLAARLAVPALAPPDRLPLAPCWRAVAWRLLKESPRADPPYLLAVALSAYGVPPRWLASCCQLPPPVLMLVFRLKLLLTLMLTLLCPQPQWQHEPPQIAAPHITPTLNATNAPPAW